MISLFSLTLFCVWNAMCSSNSSVDCWWNPLRWDSFSSEVLWCILNLLLWLHPHPRWAAEVAPESLWVWRAWWGFDVYFAMGDESLCQNRIGSVSARMNVMQPVTTQRTVLVWNINMHNTTAHKTPHGSVNRNKLCQGDSEDNPDIYGWKWDSQRWLIKRCMWNAKLDLSVYIQVVVQAVLLASKWL